MSNPLVYSFLQSGLVGKLVIIVLLGFSIVTWSVIASKLLLIRRRRKESKWFFWNFKKYHKADIFCLYTKKLKPYNSYLPTLYKGVCKELATMMNRRNHTISRQELNILATVLQRLISEQTMILSKSLIVLGTSASICPLLGLFGTVWGVMNVFKGIGLKGAANLSSVAPGIAEALGTTVAGLIVAIPAVVFYNYFVNSIKTIQQEMNNFATEYLVAVEKQHVLANKHAPVLSR